MPFGLTDDGFVIKTLADIKTEIENELKNALGPELNTSATSVMGQLVAIFASKAQEIWELSQAVYNSQDPDLAAGEALDALGALTGTIRLPATNSTVTATINLDNGTTVPAGSVASVSGNATARFITDVDVTNSSGSTDDFSVAMTAESTGIVVANSGTLTVIETPISGWNSITNAVDAELGTAIESDNAYRIRRDEELRVAGNASIEAIKADVLSVDDVTFVNMFENITLAVDGNGLPGKSFETLVLGGVDLDVATAIFESKAAGIETFGSSSEVVTDTGGNNHTIEFSRPTEIDLFVGVDITVDSGVFPGTGEQDIKDAIKAFADANFTIGDDIIASQFCTPVFSVAGVEDLTATRIYDGDTLGPETLTETDFGTHANWDATGDFDDTGGNAAYTHSAGSGTLTQESGDFAAAAVADRFYQFDYTVSGSSGDPAASITTAFADTAASLNLADGSHSVVFLSADAPGDFVISATSTSGGFTLDDFSLKQISTATGNYTVDSREIAKFDTSRMNVVVT